MFCCRYLISDFEGGSLLRIEPVRKKRDEGEVECVAENAHGDPVTARAALKIYDGECWSGLLFLHKSEHFYS